MTPHIFAGLNHPGGPGVDRARHRRARNSARPR
jgi:hypothetical protein